jgi:hypothetical protein
MNIRPCGRTATRTDGQTDMTKLIVAFPNFANAPKKTFAYLLYCLSYYKCVTKHTHPHTYTAENPMPKRLYSVK